MNPVFIQKTFQTPALQKVRNVNIQYIENTGWFLTIDIRWKMYIY